VKRHARWHSPRVRQDLRLVRWGVYGCPVLVFPTAGGDAEEIERHGVVDSLGALLGAGRVKIYSVDSLAGRAWLERDRPPEHRAWLQRQFLHAVYHEVVPAIRNDCRSPCIELLVAGASIGAFNALACLCLYPDVFRACAGLSGTYDLARYADGRFTQDLYFSSPLHFLPGLEGSALAALRRRFALLAFGGGRWEDPGESWRVADVLGRKGVPNRVDPWGPEFDHDWPTWRRMLPRYLEELCGRGD
jgi:esterase/lipase superfamily enzyme